MITTPQRTGAGGWGYRIISLSIEDCSDDLWGDRGRKIATEYKQNVYTQLTDLSVPILSDS